MKNQARSLRMSQAPASRVPAEFKRVFVVGITPDGYVPVVEDPYVGAPELFVGICRSIIRLPAVTLAQGGIGFEQQRAPAVAQLRSEFGYDADELVPMGSGVIPGFLLAPLLRSADGRPGIGAVPGVYEVSLRAIPEWLQQRKAAGAIESRSLHRGLMLAREAFPRWAGQCTRWERARLNRAMGGTAARAPASAVRG